MEKTNESRPSFFETITEGDEATCRTLWLSVILQQILDARGKFGNSITQRQAEIWLEGRGEVMSDFAEVCRLAGVSFEKTRRRCAEILADDSIAIDFRATNRNKDGSRSSKSRKRYFRRVETNQRNRRERARILSVFQSQAANDNLPHHANDNVINPTEENQYDQ